MTSSASFVRSFIFGAAPLHILEIKKPPRLHFFDLSILHERESPPTDYCRSSPLPLLFLVAAVSFARSFVRPSLERTQQKPR